MRIRIVIAAFAMIAAACGGDGDAGTTSTSGPGTTGATTTTTEAPTTTAAPTTTTTTLIQGPVDVLVLTPYALQISSFGPTGVGPVPGSGLTMALAAVPLPPAAPPGTRAAGDQEPQLIGIFGASIEFPGDCLGFTLWADDFSSRYIDGYVPLTEAGCGEPGGPIIADDQVLLKTDRTLVLDLGPIPGGSFSPAFQVQDTAGDAGFYSVGQDVVVDPSTIPTLAGGLLLPFGGDLLEVSGGRFTPIRLPDPAPGSCEPGDNTVCLLDGRFRVEASFSQATGGPGESTQVGPGWSVPIGSVDVASHDEGGFWFLNEDNVEVVIKVLDGCNINGSFWMLFTSFVEIDLTLEVTDTGSGETKTYEPPSAAFPAVTDTLAFATCP